MKKYANQDHWNHEHTERYVRADYALGQYGDPEPTLRELRRIWSGRVLPFVRR